MSAADHAWIERELAGVDEVREELKRAEMARRTEFAQESIFTAADAIRGDDRQSCRAATRAEAAPLTRALANC